MPSRFGYAYGCRVVWSDVGGDSVESEFGEFPWTEQARKADEARAYPYEERRWQEHKHLLEGERHEMPEMTEAERRWALLPQQRVGSVEPTWDRGKALSCIG